MRSMVEGAHHSRNNHFEHPMDIVQHLRGRYVQHSIAVQLKETITLRVTEAAARSIVRVAINLDDQRPIASVEIRHIRSNRVLTPHLEAALLSLETLP